ncbi:hypothetical protein GCM10017687_79610 [Streptomyces echinatus]
MSIARSELPAWTPGSRYLDGDDSEFLTLRSVLAIAAEERTARYEQAVARRDREGVKEPDGPVAVVVPLLAGPDNRAAAPDPSVP